MLKLSSPFAPTRTAVSSLVNVAAPIVTPRNPFMANLVNVVVSLMSATAPAVAEPTPMPGTSAGAPIPGRPLFAP